MAGKLAIHIPPDANPDNIIQLISALAATGASFATAGELLSFADGIGVGSRTEIQSMAANMGLIEKSGEKLQISAQGCAFARVKETARGEVLHFLVYSGWEESAPSNFLPSWAYRVICNEYWDASTVELSSGYLEQQVTAIINLAEQTFSEMNIGVFDGISFSRKSLTGARKWLAALTPPVIEDGKFERRSFCSPELLLLAIGYIMRDEPEATDVDILLSRPRREEICRVCLLDPAALDQTLDWMIPLFPRVIVSSEEAGFYGRYIRLRKRPVIEDIVR